MILSKYYVPAFFVLIFLLFFRPDPIPINGDDFWVFNIVRDMVENPSYYSLSGSGYRLVHKLIYFPFFWLFDFDVQRLSVVTVFITALFSTGVAYMTYKFFAKLWGETTGLVSAFLVGTSNAMYYTTWYWSSTHLIIGTTFFMSGMYSLYFVQRKFLWWSVFAGLAMFSRETFAIPVALITTYIVWQDSGRSKWWTLAPVAVFAAYLVLNKIFLGAFINPTFAGHVQFDIDNLAINDTYSRHLSQTLLLPLLFFFLVFLAVNTVKKGLTISHPVLILWAIGHLVTLLMTANADKRYLIPLLPLVFAFGTRQVSPYLEEKRARTILIWVMIIWHAVFLSRQALSAFSPEVWTFILHIAIYGLIVYVLSGVLRRTLKAITGTLFLLLILSSAIIQLSMTYSFFVYQYDWTTTPNDAVEYLAKHASANATVLTNKRNSLTTPDEHWFTAFRRPDLKTEYNAEAGNKTGILWSTPTSKLETDETGALAKILELTPIATFGERHKKYPLMKISSSTEKRWQQFFDTGTLFMIEESTAYKVILYKEE